MEQPRDTNRRMDKNISRRSFGKRAVVGIAGLAAAPMFLPQAAKGANDTIGIGIIGAGVRAPQLVGDISRGGRIVAVCDVDLGRARNLAERVNADDVYQDYRKLLERRDIDAVVIATPAHWHALQCIHAAQAGKDIYCEKPLAHSIVEGRRMVEAVRKYDRVCQVGVQGRMHHSTFIGVHNVHAGSLGKITRVHGRNHSSPMVPRFPAEDIPEDFRWDLWTGPAEKLPYNRAIRINRGNPSWVSLKPYSGSSLTDWGSHGLDLAQWGLDLDDGGPEEVWVEGEPYEEMYSTPEDPGQRQGGPNQPIIKMKYPGDIELDLSGGGGVRAHEVQFVGENGTINISIDGFSANPSELIVRPTDDEDEQVYRGFGYARSHGIVEDWFNCIKDRSRPAADIEAGQRTTTVCHLGNIARWVSGVTGETGKRLKWDAENERFTNSPEANQFLLSRYYNGYELPDKV